MRLFTSGGFGVGASIDEVSSGSFLDSCSSPLFVLVVELLTSTGIRSTTLDLNQKKDNEIINYFLFKYLIRLCLVNNDVYSTARVCNSKFILHA